MTINEIRFRPIVASDANTIFTMVSDLALDVYQDRLVAQSKVTCKADDLYKHLSGTIPSFHGIIAEDSDCPLGVSLFFPIFSSWRGKRGIFIQDLYIVPNRRNEGIGKQLLIQVINHAQKMWGIGYLSLSVHETNILAQGFYNEIGLAWESEERIFSIEETALLDLADSQL